MKLVLSTAPEEPAELAMWLERQIAGPDLGRLMDELSALHRSRPGDTNLESVLSQKLPAVLERGLRVLSPRRLRLLLRNPSVLGELQDAIVEAGTAYWHSRFNNPELAAVAGRARMALPDEAPVANWVRIPLYRKPWIVSLATAAAVLVGVYLYSQTGKREATWGWNNPTVLTAAKTRGDHLSGLASAAEEWRSRPRDSTDDLRKSLREMRDGCTKVLAAEHKQLTPEDRAWLAERCVAWGTKLDKHLADLQTGRPVDEVRKEADETVEKLVQALRTRAST